VKEVTPPIRLHANPYDYDVFPNHIVNSSTIQPTDRTITRLLIFLILEANNYSPFKNVKRHYTRKNHHSLLGKLRK